MPQSNPIAAYNHTKKKATRDMYINSMYISTAQCRAQGYSTYIQICTYALPNPYRKCRVKWGNLEQQVIRNN
jgi:hypothetical protein